MIFYFLGFSSIRRPVDSGISKWFFRRVSQDVCPWNEKFAQPLSEEAFRPRAVLAGKDAGTLARELLAMSAKDFSAAFKGSPMKRAKLRGLKRNASVVLGSLRNPSDVTVLAAALSDLEPLVRRHAAWALSTIGTPAESESDETVCNTIKAALSAATR